MPAFVCVHADRQTDRRMDGLTYTPSRTRACKHTKACNDERTHVRSNIWTLEHARGQTDRQTDRWTDSHIRRHARAHAHTRTLACLHEHTMHSGTYARTDRHTHTCSYGGKHPSTNMEVRSKKLEDRSKEVRNKKCPYPAFVIRSRKSPFQTQVFYIRCDFSKYNSERSFSWVAIVRRRWVPSFCKITRKRDISHHLNVQNIWKTYFSEQKSYLKQEIYFKKIHADSLETDFVFCVMKIIPRTETFSFTSLSSLIHFFEIVPVLFHSPPSFMPFLNSLSKWQCASLQAENTNKKKNKQKNYHPSNFHLVLTPL